MTDEVYIPPEEPIHEWFELSYSSYLVIPRSVLQSLPVEWQKKFVALLGEAQEMGVSCPDSKQYYHVDLCVRTDEVDEEDQPVKGTVVTDDLADYERGRRKIELPMPGSYAYEHGKTD